jgi:DNA-directed RNA polymerase specialized sigma24 family protein
MLARRSNAAPEARLGPEVGPVPRLGPVERHGSRPMRPCASGRARLAPVRETGGGRRVSESTTIEPARARGHEDAPVVSLQIARAVSGEPVAVRALIGELTPVVQARVARVLIRGGGAQRGSLLRQDVADLTQDVLASLFADGGKILKSWRPDGGLGLPGFVGMVAEREALSRVRSRRRSPMTEAPTDDVALERVAGSTDAEGEVLTRSALGRVVRGLERALSPLGMRVFRALFVEEADVETACRELELSPEALYQWRTRIRKAARDLARDGDEDGGESR